MLRYNFVENNQYRVDNAIFHQFACVIGINCFKYNLWLVNDIESRISGGIKKSLWGS